MQISTSWQDERWHYADTACRHIAALLPMLPAEYGKHMFTYGTVRRDSSVPFCLFIRIFPFAGAEGERSDACLFFEHAAKITVVRKTDCFGYLSELSVSASSRLASQSRRLCIYLPMLSPRTRENRWER